MYRGLHLEWIYVIVMHGGFVSPKFHSMLFFMKGHTNGKNESLIGSRLSEVTFTEKKCVNNYIYCIYTALCE